MYFCRCIDIHIRAAKRWRNAYIVAACERHTDINPCIWFWKQRRRKPYDLTGFEHFFITITIFIVKISNGFMGIRRVMYRDHRSRKIPCDAPNDAQQKKPPQFRYSNAHLLVVCRRFRIFCGRVWSKRAFMRPIGALRFLRVACVYQAASFKALKESVFLFHPYFLCCVDIYVRAAKWRRNFDAVVTHGQADVDP